MANTAFEPLAVGSEKSFIFLLTIFRRLRNLGVNNPRTLNNPQTPIPMKNTHSAFTLIELLVVITIIAILASIALPVFNGVTERANQTKDLSNAKQIGLALKLFASDNNGAFPSKGAGRRLQCGHRFDGGRRFQRRLLVAFPQLLEERRHLHRGRLEMVPGESG